MIFCSTFLLLDGYGMGRHGVYVERFVDTVSVAIVKSEKLGVVSMIVLGVGRKETCSQKMKQFLPRYPFLILLRSLDSFSGIAAAHFATLSFSRKAPHNGLYGFDHCSMKPTFALEVLIAWSVPLNKNSSNLGQL